ncbi:U3 small nucleolar ribonucleoprotein complex, subunit Mpp10 [Artemisia annua]|uniref:U3 small nucleolar ribonucleoprotein protein MPP10 n=1 Tax=Artemisia annua TaxID=35608 RepID=A0A2U1P602_ARTAN|nr:U3 small nucleolar ribonucleoprotein complex, subunit Mpp10 [Artemisia annua]
MAATPSPSAGIEALHRLKSTEPPSYLTPSPDLSTTARIASQHLFTSLKPYTPKSSPFDRLLVDSHFDAEQIWQQIDLQSNPLISSLKRHVTTFINNPPKLVVNNEKVEKMDKVERELGFEGFEDADVESDDDDDVEDEGDEVESDEDEVERGEGGGGVEDSFLNISEMKRFMEDDEAREYGLNDDDDVKKKKKKKSVGVENVFGDEDGEEDDDEDEEDELGVFGLDGDEDDSEAEEIRYEDFFESKKKVEQNKKPKVNKEVEDIEMSEEEEEEEEKEEENEDSETGDEDMESDDETKKGNLSTHEKQMMEQRAKIEQVEKENLEAKSWTMQGEVTATKRPKNSALEADLDWERNANPPPVITEEFSLSIEELIKKRITEGQFDDAERASSLPSKAPREMKELDENQSKKGLGEIYADEYAQKTGLVSQALTFSDEQKKEASLLFKKLCLKLDALSHFHFTPKPIIEDMSIQTNVPALAMEEIAPLAVSDAAMLAPEEVFSGKGDFKEEAELTQADRKRRRASKKRKFKGTPHHQ